MAGPRNNNQNGQQMINRTRNRLLNNVKQIDEERFVVRKSDDAGYGRENYSSRMREMNDKIAEILQNRELLQQNLTEEQMDILNEKLEKLKFREERNLSQQLLNSRRAFGRSDSPEMKKVKDTVADVEERLMTRRLWSVHGDPISLAEMDSLLGAYRKAIDACKYYVDTKTTKTGMGRYNAVRDKMASLMQEYAEYQTIRQTMSWEKVGRREEDRYNGEDWTGVENFADLLIEARLREMRGENAHEPSEDYEENIRKKKGTVALPENIPADPTAQLILKLLTKNEVRLIADGNEAQTKDNVFMTRFLYRTLMSFRADGGFHYFHSGTAGEFDTKHHTTRRFVNAQHDTQRSNVMFGLRQDLSGRISISFSEGQSAETTIVLGGKEEVLDHLRLQIALMETTMNNMTGVGRNRTGVRGTEMTDEVMSYIRDKDFTLSMEDEDYKQKKAALKGFDQVADIIIKSRFSNISAIDIENATSDAKKQALLYIMDHRNEDPAVMRVELIRKLGAGVVIYPHAKEDYENAKGGYQNEKAMRDALEDYILRTTGIPAYMLKQKTTEELHGYASNLSELSMRPDELRAAIMQKNGNGKKVYVIVTKEMETINSKSTLELMRNRKVQGEKLRGKIKFKEKAAEKAEEKKAKEAEQKKKGPEWSGEQMSVKNFIAELLYSHETWETDFALEEKDNQKKVFERYKRLFSNPEFALSAANMLKDPDLIRNTLSQIPFLKNYDEKGNEVDFPEDQLVAPLKGALDALFKDKVNTDQPVEEMAKEIQNVFAEGKTDVEMQTLNGRLVVANQAFEGFSQEVIEGRIEHINRILKKQIGDQFAMAKKERRELPSSREKRISKKEKEDRIKAENQDLKEQLAESALTGDSEQAKFVQKVLEQYFEHIAEVDRRSVMAYMFREAKPVGADAESRKVSEESCLKGMINGAGPLLQKLLQGLQMDGVPEILRQASADVRSNLMPIPREIIEAQLAEQVEKSDKKIVGFEIDKTVGAASVGQTLLGRVVYAKEPGADPKAPNPTKEVVIKVLRPDVENRLEREVQVVSGLASEVSDSMKKSYDGVVARIRQELHLEKEAENVKLGQKHYDKKYSLAEENHVKSMKLCDGTEADKNIMILEKADGDTVDRYLNETEAKVLELCHGLIPFKNGKIDQDVFVGENDGELVGVVRRYDLRKTKTWLKAKTVEMAKRQKYLNELAQKWYEQVLFAPEEGQYFFHGDLHSGNIMLDDKGATIIDYGNATKLNEKQRTSMIRIVAAAAAGQGIGDEDSGPIVESIQELVASLDVSEQEMEKITGENGSFTLHKEELVDYAAKLFAKGNGKTTMTKVALLLEKAQSLGIPMPPEVANFAQAQLRLQNTMDTYTALMTTVRSAADSAAQRIVNGDFTEEYGMDFVKKYERGFLDTTEEKQAIMKDAIMCSFIEHASEKELVSYDEVLSDRSEEGKKEFEDTFLPEYIRQDEEYKVMDAYKDFRAAQERNEDPQELQKLKGDLLKKIHEANRKHYKNNRLCREHSLANTTESLKMKEAIPTYIETMDYYLSGNCSVEEEGQGDVKRKIISLDEAVKHLEVFFGEDFKQPRVQKLVSELRVARKAYEDHGEANSPDKLKAEYNKEKEKIAAEIKTVNDVNEMRNAKRAQHEKDEPKARDKAYAKIEEEYKQSMQQHAAAFAAVNELEKAYERKQDQVQKEANELAKKMYRPIMGLTCLGMISLLKKMPEIKGERLEEPTDDEYLESEPIAFTDVVAEVIIGHKGATLDAVGKMWAIWNGPAMANNF